ncbi:MAG: hypothetical protein K6E84_08460 [Lachnospiraceae bacterium]|nr:hypothetical protein [Lachnospiraceae bacterium]
MFKNKSMQFVGRVLVVPAILVVSLSLPFYALDVSASFVESEEVIEAQPPALDPSPAVTPEGTQDPDGVSTQDHGHDPGKKTGSVPGCKEAGSKPADVTDGKTAIETTETFTVPDKPVIRKHLSVPAGSGKSGSLEDETKEDPIEDREEDSGNRGTGEEADTLADHTGPDESIETGPGRGHMPTGMLVTVGLLLLAAGIFRIITGRKGEQNAAN